jgi:hypothetical protein
MYYCEEWHVVTYYSFILSLEKQLRLSVLMFYGFFQTCLAIAFIESKACFGFCLDFLQHACTWPLV